MTPEHLTGLAGLVAALATLIGTVVNAVRVDRVQKEVSHNHGSSLKDAVTRIEERQKGLIKNGELMAKEISSLGHQIGEIRESANVVHEDYAARLRRLEESK